MKQTRIKRTRPSKDMSNMSPKSLKAEKLIGEGRILIKGEEKPEPTKVTNESKPTSFESGSISIKNKTNPEPKSNTYTNEADLDAMSGSFSVINSNDSIMHSNVSKSSVEVIEDTFKYFITAYGKQREVTKQEFDRAGHLDGNIEDFNGYQFKTRVRN